MRMADVGTTAMSGRLPNIVIKASAKPRESALRSSTSLKKTKGRTAIEVKGFKLLGVDAAGPCEGVLVAKASRTASADGNRSAGFLYRSFCAMGINT